MRNIGSILVALVSSAGVAHADLSPAAIQTLSRTHGVVITTSIKGATIMTTWRRNGVIIARNKNSSSVQVLEHDGSGRGAILCQKAIYVAIKEALDFCPPAANQVIRTEVDEEIGLIDKFIVRNSLEPVSLAHLRDE